MARAALVSERDAYTPPVLRTHTAGDQAGVQRKDLAPLLTGLRTPREGPGIVVAKSVPDKEPQRVAAGNWPSPAALAGGRLARPAAAL